MINSWSSTDGTNILPFFWTSMTEEEKLQYYQDLGNRLQEHRYRYYGLDDPVIEDYEYDHIERVYKEVSRNLSLKDVAIDMVDWDVTKPGALESKRRVQLRVDYYSIERKRIEAIWKKIGKPRYIRKSEAK